MSDSATEQYDWAGFPDADIRVGDLVTIPITLPRWKRFVFGLLRKPIPTHRTYRIAHAHEPND